MHRSSSQKANKETEDLNNIMCQLNLADIYITFDPTVAKYTFISNAHRTFTRKIKIITSIFSEHNGIKLETDNKKRESHKCVELKQHS